MRSTQPDCGVFAGEMGCALSAGSSEHDVRSRHQGKCASPALSTLTANTSATGSDGQIQIMM